MSGENLRLKYIPIEKIELWREANSRQLDVLLDIEELAKNVNQVGLQNPIIVQEEIPDQKYKIISGQRRFLACQRNGMKRIPCLISPHMTLMEAKIASFSENVYRRDMNPKDISDVADYLFKKFDSIRKVADSLGVTVQTATKYIGYAKVPDEIKDLVPKFLTVGQALTIYTKYADVKKAIEIATKIAKIKKRAERRRLVAAVKVSAEEDDFETIQRRSRNLRDVKYIVHFYPKSAVALEKAAKSTSRDEEDVIVDSTEKWLQDNDYLKK